MTDILPLEFIVLEREDGGYEAHSVGACIFTEANDLVSLRQEIRDAVCCHFDDNCKPGAVRLRFVTTVRVEDLCP